MLNKRTHKWNSARLKRVEMWEVKFLLPRYGVPKTDRSPGFIHVDCTDWRGQQPLYLFTRSKDYVCGFPGGPVVKNPLCSAGDASSNPGLEDCTCLGATKPMSPNHWSPCALECAPQKEPLQREVWAPQFKGSPRSATRESPRAATKTQCSQKKIHKYLNVFFLKWLNLRNATN